VRRFLAWRVLSVAVRVGGRSGSDLGCPDI